MDDSLRGLLAEVYADGTAHDAAEPDRLRRRRNLEPDAAALLTLVLRVAGARDVVEIGTSNGYSAIWLADAVRDTGGRLTTVDVEEWPGVAANLDRSGLAGLVRRRIGDGGAILADLADASVDLLFLDAERVEYAGWWPHPVRVTVPGLVAVHIGATGPGTSDPTGSAAGPGPRSANPARTTRSCRPAR